MISGIDLGMMSIKYQELILRYLTQEKRSCLT
jgi:hypothetical protein